MGCRREGWRLECKENEREREEKVEKRRTSELKACQAGTFGSNEAMLMEVMHSV